MKKILSVIAFAVLGVFVWNQLNLEKRFFDSPKSQGSTLYDAYRNQQSDLQVEGRGEVIRLLPDDDDGSPHQRFILRMDSGQTLLIAHNISLAPRISSLRKGDIVDFYGEYEWNSKGGVIHWTHDDPQGRHIAGWLRHRGRTYQ